MSLIRVVSDFNISPRAVEALRALYGHHGYDFLHLRTLVNKRAPDTFWEDEYKRFGGKFVISGDCRIAYKPHEAIAFIDNGLITAFPSENWMDLYQNEKAVLLTYYWPMIATKFREAPEGSCWRIPITGVKGHVVLKPIELVPLEIPTGVLQAARQERNDKRA